MPSLLLCCVGRRPKSFSKQHEQLENGRTERRPCHTAVTTRCGSGELTGDGSRRFPMVRTGRESLRDSQVRPLSAWGSSGANANARRPARQSFRFSSPNTMARLGEQEIVESAPDAGVGVLWPSREVMPTRRGGRAACPLTSSFIHRISRYRRESLPARPRVPRYQHRSDGRTRRLLRLPSSP